MSLDSILTGLVKLKRTSKDHYIACCPAHADKHPSMTIRALNDGRTLIHCFAGCDVEKILSALGLQLSDLYPEPLTSNSKAMCKPFNSYNILSCIVFEARIASIAAIDIINGKALSESEKARLILAASRLNEAYEICHG